jgi:hypothetical protein
MELPKPSEGGSYTPPPAGTHPAVCYSFVDMGTQSSNFQGKPMLRRKILLSWEITDPEIRAQDGEPMSVSSSYTWSMDEKANLRKMLEGWRGVPFVDADFGSGGFDIKKVIGLPCLVSIVHETKDGKNYANVKGVMKLPRGMTVDEPVKKKTYLALTPELFDRDVFAGLGDRLQEKIKSSPEYQSLMRQGDSGDYMSAHHGDVTGHLNDDIPF